MQDLFFKIKTLQTIKGTNEKKKFIRQNQDDELFINTLEFLLNPYKVTNVSKKKIVKKVKSVDNTIDTIEDLFDFLINACSGKDSDIAKIQAFIRDNDEFEEELQGLVTKSTKLGVKAKLVNDALRYDLIKSFSCMLGESYFKNTDRVKGQFILSTKLDGSRILVLKENGKVEFYSRQGQKIEGLVEIEEEVKKLPFDNGVLDGELLAEGDFEDNSAQYKETMKRSRIKGEKRGLQIITYDYIEDIKKFFNGVDDTPCIDRKNKLEKLIASTQLEHIKYLYPLYIGEDQEQINVELQKAINDNQEGIMVNISKSPYECKRSKNLLKVKQFSEADVFIYDIVEGDSRLKGMVGALKSKFIYQGEVCECEIGTGLNEYDRITLFNNPELIINKVITIKYFEVSQDSKTKKYSLRFPVFLGMDYIREDKKVLEDTNIE